jgi:hypothetical protein
VTVQENGHGYLGTGADGILPHIFGERPVTGFLPENAKLLQKHLLFSGNALKFAPQTCHEYCVVPKIYVWEMHYATQHIFK